MYKTDLFLRKFRGNARGILLIEYTGKHTTLIIPQLLSTIPISRNNKNKYQLYNGGVASKTGVFVNSIHWKLF